jgi:DNA ligase-1
MPKNVKPAPPQQSSLAEMWGAGRKKRTVEQPPPPKKAEEEAKEIEKVNGMDGHVPANLACELTLSHQPFQA